MTTLEELLGIDPESPEVLRAELLADNDRGLLRCLVDVRKARGLSQAEVGRLMGITQPSVAQFEAYDSNPTLAKIRRYAHAVRALIVHRVEIDEGQLFDRNLRTQWVTSSINMMPVESMANVVPSPAPTIRVAAIGAASFQLSPSADSNRTHFALAA